MSESGDGKSPRLSIPSPIRHKRNRTLSEAERARSGKDCEGVVVSFCREKGHGFINTEEFGQIFVHVFDIDGELIPQAGDHVRFKVTSLPFNDKKFQAVHVKITNYSEGLHKRWDDPVKHV